MFIQVIHGKAKDAGAIAKQSQRWQDELAPGATGWLGATEGTTDDGEYIAVVRFESREAAEANSKRPEQGEWWNETSQYFDGEVTFHDCDEVDTSRGGGSDDAGFVQVMEGRASDPARAKALFGSVDEELAGVRDDVIGTVIAWDGDVFTQAIYFTSEADAREGEKRMGALKPEQRATLDELQSLSPEVKFYDLRNPTLTSP